MASAVAVLPAGGGMINDNNVFITQRGERMDGMSAPSSSSGATSNGNLDSIIIGVSQATQATLLLKKKKEMREVDDALSLMRDEYRGRMAACELHQKEFERNQQEMKEQVTRFEKFILENDAKRHRSEMKMKQERRTLMEKEEEARLLDDQLRQTEKEQQKLLQKLGRLKRFKEYLLKTSHVADLEEISDLLNRHQTLVDLQNDMQQQVESMENETEELRIQLQTLTIETQNHLLVENSLFYADQKTLETLRARVKKDTEARDAQEGRAHDAQRDTGEVVMAIRNLYTRCLSAGRTSSTLTRLMLSLGGGGGGGGGGGEKDTETELVEQLGAYLRVIQERIVDVSEIVRDYEYVQKDKDKALLEKAESKEKERMANQQQDRKDDGGLSSKEKKGVWSSRSSAHK